jgi:hypothetical protein
LRVPEPSLVLLPRSTGSARAAARIVQIEVEAGRSIGEADFVAAGLGHSFVCSLGTAQGCWLLPKSDHPQRLGSFVRSKSRAVLVRPDWIRSSQGLLETIDAEKNIWLQLEKPTKVELDLHKRPPRVSQVSRQRQRSPPHRGHLSVEVESPVGWVAGEREMMKQRRETRGISVLSPAKVRALHCNAVLLAANISAT